MKTEKPLFKPPFVRWLARKGACDPGLHFASRFETASQAWKACKDAGWMLWALNEAGLMTARLNTQIAVAYADHVIKRYSVAFPEDKRPHNAIKAAKAWLKNPTDKNKEAAETAAHQAYKAHQAAAVRSVDAAWMLSTRHKTLSSAASAAHAAADAAAAVTYDNYYILDGVTPSKDDAKWITKKIREIAGNPWTRFKF